MTDDSESECHWSFTGHPSQHRCKLTHQFVQYRVHIGNDKNCIKIRGFVVTLTVLDGANSMRVSRMASNLLTPASRLFLFATLARFNSDFMKTYTSDTTSTVAAIDPTTMMAVVETLMRPAKHESRATHFFLHHDRTRTPMLIPQATYSS